MSFVSGKSDFRNLFICVLFIVVCPTWSQIPVDASPEASASHLPSSTLTPEILGMPRPLINLDDRQLQLFNGRGAVSVRDRSLTGLEGLQFPPINVRNYRFFLAFREVKSKVLIQDITPNLYDEIIETGHGRRGLNFGPGAPFVLLLQRAYWEPNAYFRTGTFHKQFGDRWISFGISTNVNVSAVKDEIYLSVRIDNREGEPLEFVVSPDQQAPESELSISQSNSQPGAAIAHPNAFTLASDQVRVTVISDLTGRENDGWQWEIPGHSERQADFAIVVQQTSKPAPNVVASDLNQRMQLADRAMRSRLQWAGESLPSVTTDDRTFDDLYRRCILSVLESRWERENFIVKPFYAVGGITESSTAWDTSYASEMLSILDPKGLRQTLLTYLGQGVLRNSYVHWDGNPGWDRWYAQSPFALMRILQDYLTQTGDTGFLNDSVKGATVFEWTKRIGTNLERLYGRPDGLLDFGPFSGTMLELRTDGYQHVVAATNGLAAAYFLQVAAWCRDRHDPDAAQFTSWAEKMKDSMNRKLWDAQQGWFVNLYPDGSRHLVLSYHLFDLLDSGVLSQAQSEAMISHLKEGEFLGPLGVYSISKADRVHWDLEDTDWGGGGQYTGEPLRMTESLYRSGHAELAWDILSRCTRWAEHFPYIPQEIFTDSLRSQELEMPVEIAPGSGVQAIIFGTFGLRPHLDGSVAVSPAYHHELGHARLAGYRFRWHSYDVVLDPWNYEVFKDGKLAWQSDYGKAIRFAPNGELKEAN